LLQVTKVDGVGAMLTAKVVNPGCFVAVAIMDNTAVNASASGGGATISITTTQAMRDFGANCNQTGHGYVSACRSWHGAPGFLDADLGGFDDTFCYATAGDGTTSIAKSWRSFKSGPGTVKYTTVVVTMNYDETEHVQTGPSSTNPFYAEAKGSTSASGGYTNSVDPSSGKITQSGVTSTQTSKLWQHDHSPGSDLVDSYQGFGYTMDAAATEIDGVSVPCGGVSFYTSANYPGGIQPVTLSQVLPLNAAAGAGYGISEIITALAGASGLNWSGFGLSPTTSGYTGHKVSSDGTITWDTVIVRTATSFTWSYTTTQNLDANNTSTRHFYGTITLSGENTSSDVAADIENNLLAPWVLNPRMIPLANDEWKGICIKVCRNEYVGAVNPFALACDGCSTYADANNYDGSIIGLPYGGGTVSCPADYYDQFYNNPGAALNVPGAGGWRLAADSILSPYATHWTVASTEGIYLPFTRGCFYNRIGVGESNSFSGQIWKTKLVESSIRLSTYDHARPYGADKNLETVSSDDEDCVSFTPVDRFTNVPPMAGRIAIKSITSDSVTGLTTVTTDPTPVQLDDHGTWPVNICDVTMTALCVATPTCLSTSAFTFPTPGTPPDFTTAKWICLQGALPTDTAVPCVAHWYWADTRGKGQAYTAEIHGDYRIAGEAERGVGLTDCDNTTPLTGWPVITTDGGEKDTSTSPTRYGFRDCSFGSFCKGWIGCAPWLIVLSGNATDAPTHGIQLNFSVSPAIDERYGNTDYLTAYQAMHDPMFQYPFCPPAPTCIPLVEARHNMPTAGMSGTEAAPTGDNFISYPVNTCEFNFVNVIVPPVQADQPVSWVHFCPHGFYVQPCP
jgi:hypothetical protein